MSQAYKGIALFTPGGDVIYGLDVDKEKRWHLDLCESLQELLGLSASPHFLVPSYTATIDQWLDPKTGEIQSCCEVYPLVKRYQPLLNAIFALKEATWSVLPWQEQYSDPGIIETYYKQFPELWENHNLIVNFNSLQKDTIVNTDNSSSSRGYILRLFISGHSQSTTEALTTLHRLLEQKLSDSYTLKVVDIKKYPEQAELNQISATPTLVRLYPEPVRQIVGEWHDFDRIIKIIATP